MTSITMTTSQMFGTKIIAPESVAGISQHSSEQVYPKPLVIYHADCLDGFAAAWCFYHYLPKEYEFHPGIYGALPPNCSDRIVYLVDFSYSKEVVKELCKVAKRVTIIDHHKTAIDALSCLVDADCDEYQSNLDCMFDLNSSGCSLAWDYVFGSTKELPQLLAHIQDRDLWRFALMNTKEVCASLVAQDLSFELFEAICNDPWDHLPGMIDAGRYILKKEAKDIKTILRLTVRFDKIDGWIVPIANVPYIYASEAGDIMSRDYANGEVFAATYYDAPEKRVFSLRSSPTGVDVSKVAAVYGGGGHKHAAGFSVHRSHPLAMI